MTLKFRTTDKGQKVYGNYDFKHGKISFRKNDKSEKFAVVLTRKNNTQTSLKSIPEDKIEMEYNIISAIDNLSKSDASFETYLKNINSKDGEFAIYGLSREQFNELITYI